MGEETPWGPDNPGCLMMSWGQVLGRLEGDGRAPGPWAHAQGGQEETAAPARAAPAGGPVGQGWHALTPFVLSERAWLGHRAGPGGGLVAPAEGWGDKGLGGAQSQGLRSLGRYPKEQKLNEMGYREKRSLRAQMNGRVKQALAWQEMGVRTVFLGLSLTRSSVLASFSHWLTLGGNKDGADINFTTSKTLLGKIAQPTWHPAFPHSWRPQRGECCFLLNAVTVLGVTDWLLWPCAPAT